MSIVEQDEADGSKLVATIIGALVDGTDPSSVRQIFTKRSAPHPAIIKTPTGGTIKGMLACTRLADWQKSWKPSQLYRVAR